MKPGESFTFECSAVGCPTSVEGYGGMYLYRILDQLEEVLYYYHRPESTDKVSLRKNYSERIQTQGSMRKNSITLSNLSTTDNGVYVCAYQKFTVDTVRCSVYGLYVSGECFCF